MFSLETFQTQVYCLMSMTVNWSFVPVYSGCVAAGAGWLQVHREPAGRTSYTWRVYNTIIINELQLIAND